MNKKRLVEKLGNKEYRDAYIGARSKKDLAFQIRLMREDRNWRQEDLARRLGVSQARVAQLEDPSYGRYSTKTLRRLASVFDVALVQRFVPFSELVSWVENLSEQKLRPASYDQDQFFVPATANSTGDSRFIEMPTEISALEDDQVEPHGEVHVQQT